MIIRGPFSLVWGWKTVLCPKYVLNGFLGVLVVGGQLVLNGVVQEAFEVGIAFGHARIVVADHGRRVFGRTASQHDVGAVSVAVVVEVALLAGVGTEITA
jgi:hypothetical protein